MDIPNDKLVRGLGSLDATMIVIGSMIGSGIFITSAESTRLISAPGWLLLAWTMAGLLTITGALCCAELAAMMPRAGGQYVFLRQAYGPAIGFLFGWTLFLVIQTGTIAAVAIAFAKFAGVFFPAIGTEHYLVRPVHLVGAYAISLSTEQLIAVLLIFLLTWVNTRGLEVGKLVQNTFTFAKTIALIGLIVVGLSLGWQVSSAARVADWWNPWANGWTPQRAQPGLTTVGGLALVLLFGKAMVGPLFAQTAWTNITFTGSEVRDPGRTLPRALLIGCGLVVTLYVLGQSRLRCHLVVRRDRASAAEPGRGGRDECGHWTVRRERDGSGDPRLDLRLQQWSHPCRGTGLLCDGTGPVVFPRDCADQRPARARGRARRARPVGGAAYSSAHDQHRPSDWWSALWQRLHPIAGIHRRGRSRLLLAARRGPHGVTSQNAGDAATLSRLGLSFCAAFRHWAGYAAYR